MEERESEKPDLYQPISLLNVLEKLVKELLKKQFVNYFKENLIIPEGNHGGRTTFSTLTTKSVIDKHTANNVKEKVESIIELGISILNLRFGGCMGSQLSSMVR